MKHTYTLTFLFIIGILLGKSCSKDTIDYLNQRRFDRSMLKGSSWMGNLTLARQDQGVIQRALVARVGLGANTSEEAIYYTAYSDKDGDRMNSAHKYVVHFKEEPPVNAFWSLTIYNEDHFLVENDLDRYAVFSYSDLKKNADNTFNIYLSRKVGKDTANWLPMPQTDQQVKLTLRCYIPSEEMRKHVNNIVFPDIFKYEDAIN